MIFLYTDFGSADIYVGQVRAVLAAIAPGVPVVDLLNDAPAFVVRSNAHLLAAMGTRLPAGSVTLAVVDPGVGTERRPVMVHYAGRTLIGPDNGLLSVIAARQCDVEVSEIVWRPSSMSTSFHGRDLFAPVAARVAAGKIGPAEMKSVQGLEVELGGADLPEVIYVDHYGNAVTGIRGDAFPGASVLTVHGHEIPRAAVFARVDLHHPLWYVNSLGLVEIACNRGSSAQRLGIAIGDAVSFKSG
jgi:S-adenosylmethionine hydrolase